MKGFPLPARRFIGQLGFMLAAMLLPLAAASAADIEDMLSDGDRACLDCHRPEASAARHLKPGRKAPVIDAQAYARSLHNEAGCDGCHEDITLPAHPGKKAPAVPKPKRTPLETVQVCKGCHAKVVKAFERSFHGERLRARKKSAPGCVDCHVPHAVTAASVQDGPHNVCLECHDDPAVTHETWLPNATRHLQTVACAACHAPEALPQVDLRLVLAKPLPGEDLAEAFDTLARQTDANHDGLDAHEFRKLLETLQASGHPAKVQGRIELRNGVRAHLMPDKSRALKDCFGCHDEDAPPYKRVVVSTLDASGAPVRYDAQRAILTSAVTVEALRGFYALGGTRLALLDLLLALGLALGLSVPALHLLARRWNVRAQAPAEQTP